MVALLLIVAAAQVDEVRGGIDVVEVITVRFGAETAGGQEFLPEALIGPLQAGIGGSTGLF